MQKILSALQEKGRIKRTNLAGIVGLNYNQCIKYVNLLLNLGWIVVILDEGYHVIITEEGTRMNEKLSRS